MVALLRHVPCCETAVIFQQFVGTLVQQPLHGLGVALACRPHQRRQAVHIGGIHLRTGRQQFLHNPGVSHASGIHQGRFAQTIHLFQLGTFVDQQLNHVGVARIAGGHQGRDLFQRRQIHIGTGVDHQLNNVHAVFFNRQKQGGFSQAIARVGCCAPL